MPNVALAVKAPAPSSSQTLLQSLVLAQDEDQATTSITALPSTSTTASTAKLPATAEQDSGVATSNTTTGPGTTGTLAKPISCGSVQRRSWTVRGWSATHLHARECLAPEALQPASALAPESNSASEAESKPRPSSSLGPQAAEVSQGEDSQQTNVQHADTPPAKGAPSIHSEPATPNVTPTPIDQPIIIQGQTVPANGQPITVNNQPVSLASGYVHVGTLSAPIPIAQVVPSTAQPIVAGTLTFQPASPSLVQVVPSPFVVGGLTFSAAQAEPSAGSSKATDEPGARPIVVGGKMYAPMQPTSESEESKEASKTTEQGVTEPAISQEQPDNLINSYHHASDAISNVPGQADSKPIVIAGTTYMPVITPVITHAPQQPPIFSFAGTSITQGGSAITISGTLISLGPSGVMIGKSSIPFSPTAVPTATRSLFPIGSQILTALHVSVSKGDEERGFEINHSTILPGSPALSISGTLYSLHAAGSPIMGPSTTALATAGRSNGVDDKALTAGGGEMLTPLGSTAVLVDGTPLSIIGGPAITDHGPGIPLASNGLAVESSTFTYATPVVMNTATLARVRGVVSGSFSTGILPSVAVNPGSATPRITGNVSRSNAPVGKVVNGVMKTIFGAFASLYVMVRMM